MGVACPGTPGVGCELDRELGVRISSGVNKMVFFFFLVCFWFWFWFLTDCIGVQFITVEIAWQQECLARLMYKKY